jgi:hypothetical protein
MRFRRIRSVVPLLGSIGGVVRASSQTIIVARRRKLDKIRTVYRRALSSPNGAIAVGVRVPRVGGLGHVNGELGIVLMHSSSSGCLPDLMSGLASTGTVIRYPFLAETVPLADSKISTHPR